MTDALRKVLTDGRGLSPINRKQALSALVFMMLLSLPTAGQSQLGRRTNALAAAHPFKENFITIEQLRTRYIESGSGSPIVMIHGNAGSVEDFNFGAVDLLSVNYRVIAVDRPGHGLSDRPNGKTATVEYQARLLHDVLASLSVSQPVLVGHSWGAALALCYALQYPGEVSGLVLVAPAAYPDHGDNRLMGLISKLPVLGTAALLAGKPIIGKHIVRTELQRAFYPQPIPRGYLQSVVASWLDRKRLRAYLEDDTSLNDSLKNLTKRYSTIEVPAVIITGDEDKIVSAQGNAYRLQAALPHAQLIALKGVGHEIPQTHPETIYTAATLVRSIAEGYAGLR